MIEGVSNVRALLYSILMTERCQLHLDAIDAMCYLERTARAGTAQRHIRGWKDNPPLASRCLYREYPDMESKLRSDDATVQLLPL